MRIAIFYFLYIGANGIFTPFLPPYFKTLGLSGKEISQIFVLMNVMLIFVPLLWGVAADRTAKPALLLKIACIGAAGSFAFIKIAGHFWSVMLVIAFYSFFATAISSLADTVAVFEARRIGTQYARLRLWGSIGFLVATLVFGELAAQWPPAAAVTACMLMMVGYVVAVQFVSEVTVVAEGPPRIPSLHDAWKLAGDPALRGFLLAGMLHWTAQQAYYFCLGLHFKDLKIDSFIGRASGIGVIAEVLILWRFRFVIQRVPVFFVIGISFLLTSLRWYLMSIVRDPWTLTAIQIIHGFSYGAFFVGSIAHLERVIPTHLLATGRALFASVVFGLGGICGNLLAGTMYDIGKGPKAFMISSMVELFAPLALIYAAIAGRRSNDRMEAA